MLRKILIASLLYSSFIYAEEYTLKEILVTTPTRKSENQKNIIADTTVITEEEIEQAGLSSLAELLQKQSGIEISNLGGPGKVSSINIRGTSSTHSIILLDGMRIGASTSGMTAIENLPLSQIEKIEIVRGPASSLYGQDGIGGVIQIFTKKGKEGFHPYLGIGYGRYQTKQLNAGISGGNKTTSYALNISGTNTDGFSAFVPDSSKASNTQNLDKDKYKNRSISSTLSYDLNKDYKIDLQYFLTTGRNMFDNRFANFSPDQNYRDKSKQEIYAMKTTGQINKLWESSIKIGKSTDLYSAQQHFNWDTLVYDPDVVDLYETTQYQMTWQNNIKLNKGSLVVLYDFLQEKIDTTDLYDKTKRTNNGFVLGYNIEHNQNTLQTSLRKDLNSQYNNEATGNIGYAYQINPQWKISSSFGTAFVAPSFNYLYSSIDSWALGNPDLKPEKSKNIEGNIKYQDNLKSFSLTAYQNAIKDFIIYEAIAENSRTNTQNLNEAKIQGITLTGNQFFEHIQLKGSLTAESPKNKDTNKYLPRRAKLYGNLSINYYIREWIFGIEQIGSGSRYDDKANNNKIEGYMITNLIANFALNEKTTINFRLDNAFDKAYALAYEGSQSSSTGYIYQTPGRSLYVNLRYDF
jgi:vitamin B12 transporter